MANCAKKRAVKRAHAPRKPEKTMRQRALGAFARNGLNTLLLDIKEDVTVALCEIEAIHQRIDAWEPKLVTLDNERRERIGVMKFLTSSRVWIVAAGAGLVGTVYQFVMHWKN